MASFEDEDVDEPLLNLQWSLGDSELVQARRLESGSSPSFPSPSAPSVNYCLSDRGHIHVLILVTVLLDMSMSDCPCLPDLGHFHSDHVQLFISFWAWPYPISMFYLIVVAVLLNMSMFSWSWPNHFRLFISFWAWPMTIYAHTPWIWSYHYCPPDPGHCLCNSWPGERGVARLRIGWRGEARLWAPCVLLCRGQYLITGQILEEYRFFFFFFYNQSETNSVQLSNTWIPYCVIALWYIQKIFAPAGIFLGNW